ncbi:MULTISPECIES: M20 family metallopeptidase [unclassified Staphylococcus]|uniref:M20 family metallopeptidase n=1 Tax=unclassified Staphylococcus TaxID=91994 RepID=UPI001880B9F9|nr:MULTISPECIES: M20 family metallopeptidase [unclassified Staphylococcus]MBF2757887.1 M20 family metallopeptidase [Staphylococcus haemolyticus]MBF2772505.1 M20 family metallopeptidase [Staphylococcus haemolyticus]MBF2776312.1 M20 family metallopeptidase [Staphylococcus haemolyticus]MBF2816566.1 M20 family metallopeptidase [Staphylococcus haemolyticus]MBF9721650.1 M20 family metallopeptidase [Staphylococcus haemolyticus]
MSNKQEILDYIENNKYDYVEISHRIHERPELGNEEIFASRTLIDKLKANDFEIETDIAGHATGFIATYDSGQEGPTIGYLAEYDALPGLGHACGHNIIGTASVLAGSALKQVINHIGGKVVVLGCPAEEGGENGSAKASYVKAGIIDDIDIALMIHPGNETYPTIDTLAVDVLDIKFYGKSAHASENADEALNALDAMISYFNGVAQLRQHIKKSQRVHGVILDGGKAANIIPDFTHARFYTRATTRKELDVLTEKVNQIARGAAIQTGCDYEFGPIQNGVNEFIKTPKLDALFEKYANEVGEDVSHDDFGFGSTDTGNVSHIVPTIHPHVKIGSRNLVGHTHRFREAAASVHGDQALIHGAKIIALMGLELIENKRMFDDVVQQHSQIKGQSR